ncbi:hypothetical protein ACWCQZ_29815 [Streptomyces sp. NPDC002285]
MLVFDGCHHPAIRARSLFSELTQSASVPLDPAELPHMPGLLQRGHVFFGNVPVRCYGHGHGDQRDSQYR